VGQLDLPLSREGRHQARQWARYFSGMALDEIYSSDLGRSVQTARVIAAGQGREVQVLPALREIDLGAWDGLGFDELRAKAPAAFRRRGGDIAGFRPPGGESFRDVWQRVRPASFPYRTP
jgi:probable phosphoglycerate mutase